LALGDAVNRRNGGGGSVPPPKNRRRRIVRWTVIAVVIVLVGAVALAGSGYVYGWIKWNSFKHPKCEACLAPKESFNILEIGSDSRVGLTGQEAAATGGNSVTGQRSDVVKIMHVDPATAQITIISIPRDTLVTMLANQNLYTNYNRINVTYNNGVDLEVRTIEANLGIPINYVIQVSFAGLINAANAIGGVWLNFPYPAKDAYSGLNITKPGCQLMRDFRSLAIVRSRHYEYYKDGQWWYDGTSDYGRIQRQDAFIRAFIDTAKGLWNPVSIDSLISALPQGVSISSNMSYNSMLGLAWKFHQFNLANLHTYTLPVISAGYVAPYGDVLTIEQPQAQQLLVHVFGHNLLHVTNPPPDTNLHPQPPPYVPVTTTTTTTTVHHANNGSGSSSVPSTTTTTIPNMENEYASYNPTPCTPH
jgi:LCP family protein required for cell wall assembly